ncbi:AAA family ATPase [Gordonia sp. DT30]|uniref:ATP-binding protein n=1 Tax=Gordonia sp. DT30 TaxID=3416546 RepID=UPI003CFAB397
MADHLGGAGSEHVRPEPEVKEDDPAGAFLREISVSGFRGIGPQTSLQITPYPGITVVSGRNGSGKSSFAEALEYALTGESYRWKKKAALWTDTWRNLHNGNPCQVRVDFAVEDGPATSIGADWAPDADLADARRWSQRKGEKRQSGVAALGWSTAIEIHRPILSYDEIGGLLEQEPSKLYDALDKLLGLAEIQDAETRLNNEHSARKQPRQDAGNALKSLKQTVADGDDERVLALGQLLRPRTPDIEAVSALVSGAQSNQQSSVAQLEAIGHIELPDLDEANSVARDLRDALANVRALADDAMRTAEARTALLRGALELRTADGRDSVTCPVCGVGSLDAEWESHTREAIERDDSQIATYREARKQVSVCESRARGILAALRTVRPIDGAELANLAAYSDAVEKATTIPPQSEELTAHLEDAIPPVIEKLSALQTEAAELASQRADLWAPIVESTMAWLTLERIARESDGIVAQLDEAKKWVKTNAQMLRDERLLPISDSAREIWAQLRQESDVDITEIALEGSRTRRKAVLKGSVNGQPTSALSVMSQGELHALALALFLPRAAAAASPFRFIVLDDPIQAMDPAKIDGFLNVLVELAKSRQIVVFSHDDRLATAIRQRSIDAHLIEVTREDGSTLVVKNAEAPARRYAEDAFALIVDENVPSEVKRRAAPGLFRFAIEAAAKQTYFTRRNAAGAAQSETEALWAKAQGVSASVALALDLKNLSGWKAHRSHRGPAMKIATAGTHSGAVTEITRDNVTDLRKTVDDILAQQ